MTLEKGQQRGADPWRSGDGAFEAEIVELVERVDDAHARVEFETVEYLQPIAEPDVFGTQIAVTVNDQASANAGFDLRTGARKPTIERVERPKR